MGMAMIDNDDLLSFPDRLEDAGSSRYSRFSTSSTCSSITSDNAGRLRWEMTKTSLHVSKASTNGRFALLPWVST